jgi:hypothetical protein
MVQITFKIVSEEIGRTDMPIAGIFWVLMAFSLSCLIFSGCSLSNVGKNSYSMNHSLLI